MFLCFLGVMALVTTAFYFIWRETIVGLVMGIMWFLTGARCYSMRDTPNDIYHLTGIFLIVVALLMLFWVLTSARTGRKEEYGEYIAETMDDLIDELEDAKDNGDLRLAKQIKQKMAILQGQDEVFNIEATADFDPESRTIRAKVRKQKQRKRLQAFDDEGYIG